MTSKNAAELQKSDKKYPAFRVMRTDELMEMFNWLKPKTPKTPKSKFRPVRTSEALAALNAVSSKKKNPKSYPHESTDIKRRTTMKPNRNSTRNAVRGKSFMPSGSIKNTEVRNYNIPRKLFKISESSTWNEPPTARKLKAIPKILVTDSSKEEDFTKTETPCITKPRDINYSSLAQRIVLSPHKTSVTRDHNKQGEISRKTEKSKIPSCRKIIGVSNQTSDSSIHHLETLINRMEKNLSLRLDRIESRLSKIETDMNIVLNKLSSPNKLIKCTNSPVVNQADLVYSSVFRNGHFVPENSSVMVHSALGAQNQKHLDQKFLVLQNAQENLTTPQRNPLKQNNFLHSLASCSGVAVSAASPLHLSSENSCSDPDCFIVESVSTNTATDQFVELQAPCISPERLMGPTLVKPGKGKKVSSSLFSNPYRGIILCDSPLGVNEQNELGRTSILRNNSPIEGSGMFHSALVDGLSSNRLGERTNNLFEAPTKDVEADKHLTSSELNKQSIASTNEQVSNPITMSNVGTNVEKEKLLNEVELRNKQSTNQHNIPNAVQQRVLRNCLTPSSCTDSSLSPLDSGTESPFILPKFESLIREDSLKTPLSKSLSCLTNWHEESHGQILKFKSYANINEASLSSYNTLKENASILCTPKAPNTNLMTPSVQKSSKKMLSRKVQEQLFSLNRLS